MAGRAGITAVGAVAISLATCASAGAQAVRHPETKNPVGAAYSHSIKAGSAKVTYVEAVTTNLAGAPQKLTIVGHGVTDLRGPKGDFVTSVPLIGDSVETRVLGSYLYLRLPAALESPVEGHKPWVAIDVKTLAGAKLGASFGQLSTTSVTPTQALSYLRSVSRSGLVTIGTSRIGGVPTTEYRVVISFAKAEAALPGSARTLLREAERYTGAHNLPVDVWVDTNHLVRRISYRLAIAKSNAPISSVESTVLLTGYGTAVNVVAPPATQTFVLTEKALSALASGLGSGLATPGAGA